MDNHNSLVSRFFLSFFSAFLVFCSDSIDAKKALIIVPIADLAGKPLTNSEILFNYDTIPLAAGSARESRSCPRLHQLLFNEIVDIIEEQPQEVRIAIPNVYYLIPQSTEPQTNYWTQKKNCIPLEILKQKRVNLRKIPIPIKFNNKEFIQSQSNNITLLVPWIEPSTKKRFSAGTRFVLTPQQKNNGHYNVYILDTANFSFKEVMIPKKLCLVPGNPRSNAERIALFVQLLQKWAHPDNGFIPYVWGGCSFINVYHNDSFTKHEINNKEKLSYFSREDIIHSNIKNGFDCSGLIVRAAQACGIPYFFKNTTTLANKLTTLQKGETLQEGDLIWIPGHVMAVASIPNNTIIEARGYRSGYGKVHELPLNKLFKDCESYNDLIKAYFTGKPLYLLNKAGEISSTITDYKPLKLVSVWN